MYHGSGLKPLHDNRLGNLKLMTETQHKKLHMTERNNK